MESQAQLWPSAARTQLTRSWEVKGLDMTHRAPNWEASFLNGSDAVLTFTIKFLIATGSFVHVVMQWRPVHGGEGCIASGSKRGVANVNLLRWVC